MTLRRAEQLCFCCVFRPFSGVGNSRLHGTRFYYLSFYGRLISHRARKTLIFLRNFCLWILWPQDQLSRLSKTHWSLTILSWIKYDWDSYRLLPPYNIKLPCIGYSIHLSPHPPSPAISYSVILLKQKSFGTVPHQPNCATMRKRVLLETPRIGDHS